MNKVINDKKTGFNWIAFLLSGSAYYAGYGRVKKGIVMAVLGFLPLTILFVNIYAGFKANKELPVKRESFNWPKSIGVFAINCLMLVTTASIAVYYGSSSSLAAQASIIKTSSTNADEFISDMSGVWKVTDTDEYFAFNFLGQQKIMQIDGDIYLVEVASVDLKSNTANLIVGETLSVVLKKIFSSQDGYYLRMTLDGDDYNLGYYSDLEGNTNNVESSQTQNSQAYKTLSLEDLKLDISSLDGSRVKVQSSALFAANELYLLENNTDTNRITVSVEGLDRDSRKQILQRCSSLTSFCTVTVSGYIEDGILIAESIKL